MNINPHWTPLPSKLTLKTASKFVCAFEMHIHNGFQIFIRHSSKIKRIYGEKSIFQQDIRGNYTILLFTCFKGCNALCFEAGHVLKTFLNFQKFEPQRSYKHGFYSTNSVYFPNILMVV